MGKSVRQIQVVALSEPISTKGMQPTAFFDANGNPVQVGGGGSVAWTDVTGKPSTFTPSEHTHTANEISNSTAVGRNVLTANSESAARQAIGASNLTTADVLNAVASKPEVAALTAIADPAAATVEDVATALNAIIAALKA